MKYIVLVWIEEEEDWLLYWYGTNRRKADQAYAKAKIRHNQVELQRVQALKMTTWDMS